MSQPATVDLSELIEGKRPGGFAVRLVFASVELAGELIGLQMGLNFAAFFDPLTSTQASAVSRFFGQMAVLLFVVVNGHLLVLMAVIKSFDAFPVDGNVLDMLQRVRLHELGAELFASALWIALPMIGFLLFVPFLIIDMVVASILMSMGMMMLPPVMIALPFKLIFFVLVDGWYLVAGSLVRSFTGGS